MKYMLDTNICIYLIKERPLSILEKFKSLSLDSICISSITQAELEYGVQKSQYQNKNQSALEEFLLPLEVMDFDSSAAYGIIRANLEKEGRLIGPMDTLIGAHAKSLNLILVTNNVKEFARIPSLTIENWL